MRVPTLELLEDRIHRVIQLIESLRAECRGAEERLMEAQQECERLRNENIRLGKTREEARKRIELLLDRLSFLQELTES